ncbi:MAG TPA: pantoate--beta-alanine ligase [Sphingomicrobium sp.]
MQTVRTSEELTRARAEMGGGTLALVPTMGALHAGHIVLIEEARRHADRVAATIFVNPTQFNDPDDLARYPRQEADDARKLEQAGCDLLWLPGVEDIYPNGFATSVHVTGVSERWEGEARPGHFDGVATIVAKLLLAVRPDVAVFGEKDFQQLAVIRRMVADLNIGVDIVGMPTVRDADGLALSSRNALLSPDERIRAVAFPAALRAARDAIRAGIGEGPAVDQAVTLLRDARFSRIDYFVLVDSATLEPVSEPQGNCRLIAAAVIGTTRLIDNMAV